MSTQARTRGALLVASGVIGGMLLLAFILVAVDRLAGDTGTTPTGRMGVAVTPPDDKPAPTTAQRSPTRMPTQPPEQAHVERPAPSPLAGLPDTDNPDVYAAAVAEVLFGMDYTHRQPADYEALFTDALWDQIVAEDRERILATIARRIPTPDMWEQMRSIRQTAEFTVDLVWEPRTGRQGRDEQWWPDGVVLRNVSGTQTETWTAPDSEVQQTTREVTVSVGLACPPAASPCRLLSIQPNVES